MSKKILLITGDGGEGFETLYAIHRFREAGYQPVVGALEKRRLNMVIHDAEPGWDTYIEKPGYCVTADIALKQVKVPAFAAVLVIGGRAPESLRNNPLVLDLVRAFDQAGKPVMGICHGVWVLAAAGVLKGRRCTSYDQIRRDIEAAGGKWMAQEAVRDGRYVTGMTWNSHPEFYPLAFACLTDAGC